MSQVIMPLVNEQIDELTEKSANELIEIKAEVAVLKKIISEMPGSVYWKSRDGRFMGCNNNMAKIFGRNSPDEIVGKYNHELFDPALAARIEEIDAEIYKSGATKNIEEYGVNQDHPATYISKKTPLYDDKGKIIGLLGVSFDITERKQMEEALKIAKEKAEEANRSKTEFITNLSHDVKTPLAGIIGIAELLTYKLNDEELDFSKILLLSSRQLLTFFDNCLDVFKLENSDAKVVTENFNLRITIDEICEIFMPTIASRGLQLNVDYPESISEHIIGSRTGIYRIILNLVSNAVKFTAKGSVTIRVRQTENILKLIVEDTGIGIPANKQEAIFEHFTRLNPSYRGKYDGSGIGLYIVHKFVSSMNGRIDVVSEPDEGSQFTVTLPMNEQPVLQPVVSANTAKINATRSTIPTEPSLRIIPTETETNDFTPEQKNISILLVEDNQVVQRIQASLLSTFGCKIDIAETGEQALEAFQPEKYDLILMDIGLPDMQGDLTAKLIRKLERNSKSTPIIALTAHVSESAATTHAAYGINDTIQKPLSREQAIAIIEKYVQPKSVKKKSG